MSHLPIDIPDFDNGGLLPAGVYVCDEETLYDSFVASFQASVTRADIYTGFTGWRRVAYNLVEFVVHWVNGSFVTNKTNPNDIDVISFYDTDYFNRLDEDKRKEIIRILNGRENTKPDYRTHSFMVLSCPLGHPVFTIFERERLFWRKWWSRTYIIDSFGQRISSGRVKGFLQMTLGHKPPHENILGERID
ncbi:MAG: DUF6932 family protein [Desulfomonilaceae bacterium]